jgi:ATP-dependent helicase IRC3
VNLRPYQTATLDAIAASRRRGVRRALITLPTGTGKTIVFLSDILRLRAEGVVSAAHPAIILAHREELLQQPYDRLQQLVETGEGLFAQDRVSVGLERAESRAPRGCEVVIASVATVGRANDRLAGLAPGLVVIDEAHHAVAASYHNALKKWGAFEPDGPYVLGCTATPKRLDRKAVHTLDGAMFEEVAHHYSIRQAVADGWLCPIRGFRVLTQLDLSGVKTQGGDFQRGALERAVDDETRTLAALQRWREVAEARKTLVFCAGVDHAQHAAGMWEAAGYRAACVHGEMPRDERAALMASFRSGDIQVLTNCEIATEGFDVPDASAIVMLRPTKSWALYVQMAGRGTRICPGKDDLIVLDVVDNCSRHSLASVPAILDLPPHMDLQGKSLEEAAKKMERLTGTGIAALQKYEPKTLEELDTIMERVDLLAAVEPSAEVAGISRFRWLPAAAGGLFLSCGGQRAADIRPNALGTYWVRLREGKTARPAVRLSEDLGASVQAADRLVRDAWPDAAAVAQDGRRWQGEPVTEKQLRMLRRFKIPPAVAAAYSKGQASALISQLMEQHGAIRRQVEVAG